MPPPVFQANHGQMSPEVRYFARGHGYTLALSPHEVRLSPADGSGDVTIAFAGSSRVRIKAEDPVAFRINSIRGSDPKGWVLNAPAWSRIRYREIQPGIDLVFHASRQGDWEYDFELAPGADVSRVHFDVRGASRLDVDSAGDLITTTQGGGSIRWRKPASYQKPGAETRGIPTAFAVSGTRVSFSLGTWDRTEALIIDPAFVFSTYFGGTGNEVSRGIGRDSSGNIYICGSSSSGDLPTTRTSYQANFKGGGASFNFGDAFLAKFTPSGALSYVTYFGGSADDVAAALAVDASGNVYVTGNTGSHDFPYLNGFQNYYGGSGGNYNGGGGDGFAAKFTSAGALVYSTYLGGSQDDAGIAIAVDGSGNAYVAGYTLSPNFPGAVNGYQKLFGGTDPSFVNANGYVGLHSGDAFVAEISPDGKQLLASTYLGGKLDDLAMAVALDSKGNVWVGGDTNSTNFPVLNPLPGQGAFGGNSPGDLEPVAIIGDGFVSELNSNLTSLLYSTFLGGSGDDSVAAIAVDSGGSVYAAGMTVSSNFPVTTGVTYKGPTTLANGRSVVTGDAFLAKLNPAAKTLTYSTLLGGSDNDFASGLALDSAGNAYIAGMTASSDFPIAGHPIQSSFGGPSNGIGDAFLAMFDPAGKLLYSSYLGGSGQDTGFGLALDGLGTAYITGMTDSSNFPTAAPYQSHLTTNNQDLSQYNSSFGLTGTNPTGYNAFLTVVSGLVSAPATLTITKSHTGSFTQGQSNANYTVTVSNMAGAGATSGTASVTETVPTGLSLVSMSGKNWTCASGTCTRNDALAGGSSYDPITVTVNVASNAPAQVVNQVSVSGGGSATANATDTTTIGAASGHPPFFSGEASLGSGVYYLQFPDKNIFGYYNYVAPSIFYHYDMGYEAFVPGTGSDVYLYDFMTNHWFYTNSTLFPYLFDFTLNSWLYYFPNTSNPGHYTTNPRYFSNLTTGKIITM